MKPCSHPLHPDDYCSQCSANQLDYECAAAYDEIRKLKASLQEMTEKYEKAKDEAWLEYEKRRQFERDAMEHQRQKHMLREQLEKLQKTPSSGEEPKGGSP